MKRFFISIFALSLIAVSAGEREDLLKKFEQECAAEEEDSEKAQTTVELVGAAGGASTLSEQHLFLAFDYKLRHTADVAERLHLIADFNKLSKAVQKLHLTPREGMGSLAGMWIYHAEANLMRQQIAIWMLDAEAEKRWKRIADVQLVLKDKSIQLDHGRATFNSVMYGEKVTLELIIYPKDTFSSGGDDFAIIRTDIRFAGNDDYSNVYLCRLKDGKLQVHAKCRMPFFTKWELLGKKLVIFGYNKAREEFAL